MRQPRKLRNGSYEMLQNVTKFRGIPGECASRRLFGAYTPNRRVRPCSFTITTGMPEMSQNVPLFKVIPIQRVSKRPPVHPDQRCAPQRGRNEVRATTGWVPLISPPPGERYREGVPTLPPVIPAKERHPVPRYGAGIQSPLPSWERARVRVRERACPVCT